MAEHIVIPAPFFVAAFWSLRLGLDYMNRPERITLHLLCFMLVTALLYLCHFAYFSTAGNAPCFLDVLYRFCNLSVFPLWYSYMCELTLRRLRRREMLAWLLPALLLTPATLSWSGTMVAVRLVFAAQVVAVLILGWRMLHSYEAIVASSFSDEENNPLRALRLLHLFLFLKAITSLAANLIGREHFLSSVSLLAIPSLLFSVLIFMLGYESTRLLPQVTAVQDEMNKVGTRLYADRNDREQDEDLLFDNEGDGANHFAQLQRNILKAMDEYQLYLLPGLKISDLALHLGSNRNYIWHAVNEGLGISFSDLVNSRRIEHFIRLARQNPQQDAEDIWIRCGFTSASTFYRCFRHYKGCSPAEYFARTT